MELKWKEEVLFLRKFLIVFEIYFVGLLLLLFYNKLI